MSFAESDLLDQQSTLSGITITNCTVNNSTAVNGGTLYVHSAREGIRRKFARP